MINHFASVFRKIFYGILISGTGACSLSSWIGTSYEAVEYMGRTSPVKNWSPSRLENHMHQQTDYHKVEDAMYVLAYKMGHSREEESREAANVYFRTYRKLYDGWIEQLRPTFLVPDSSGKHPVSLVMDPKEYPAAYIRRLSVLRVSAADAIRQRPNATYISDAFNRLPKFTDEQVELNSRGTLSWIPYGSYPE